MKRLAVLALAAVSAVGITAAPAGSVEAGASCANHVAYYDRIPGVVRSYCKGPGTVSVVLQCRQNLGPSYTVTRTHYLSGTFYRTLQSYCGSNSWLTYYLVYRY